MVKKTTKNNTKTTKTIAKNRKIKKAVVITGGVLATLFLLNKYGKSIKERDLYKRALIKAKEISPKVGKFFQKKPKNLKIDTQLQ